MITFSWAECYTPKFLVTFFSGKRRKGSPQIQCGHHLSMASRLAYFSSTSANRHCVDVSWAFPHSLIWLHQHSDELRLLASPPPPLVSLLLSALGAATVDFLEPRVRRSSSAAASLRTEAAFNSSLSPAAFS